MYADKITNSMEIAISETKRRREIQDAHNIKNGITPQTIIKAVRKPIRVKIDSKEEQRELSSLNKKEKLKLLKTLDKEMRSAAGKLDFERAAELRDVIIEIKASI